MRMIIQGKLYFQLTDEQGYHRLAAAFKLLSLVKKNKKALQLLPHNSTAIVTAQQLLPQNI